MAKEKKSPIHLNANDEKNIKKSKPAEKPVKKATATVKKSVQAAKKPATTVASKSVSYHIHFEIGFHTRFGQSIFVMGNHEKLGNNDPEKALPLSYLNAEAWNGQIVFEPQEIPLQPIIYNYVLKDVDGSITIDWGTDKQIDFASFQTEKVYIKDAWNNAGYNANVFYTEPFKNILLKKNNQQFKPGQKTNKPTHQFRIKYPLLKPNEVMCISGNNDVLGNWSTLEPVLMNKAKDKDYWELNLNLENVHFPISYKYGIFNKEEAGLVRFENGNNRLLFNHAQPKSFTIINDGFAYLPDNTWKGAGVAIPVFSLRSNEGMGIGEFKDLKLLVDWAEKTGLKLIQILPVNDTIATYSWKDSYPYSAISAFALNPIYLNISSLVDGKLKALYQEIDAAKQQLNRLPDIDFDLVVNHKFQFLKRIYPIKKSAIFKSKGYKDFFVKNEHWLVPYSVFCYLRDEYGTVDFNKWPKYKQYSSTIAATLQKDNEASDAIAFYFFVQYLLHLQLKEATEYAHSKGIIVKGDIPIGIYRSSCDAWQKPELYHMEMQAGAPPDDFTIKGQNWGFPTYNWQKMQENGFAWWKRRFEQMSHYFDAFRIDHILGFFRIWSIPINQVEGIMGYFVPAIPVHINEFNKRNIYFDKQRYCKPYITDDVLWKIFNTQNEAVKQEFLEPDNNNHYHLKPAFDSQRKVEDYFSGKDDNDHNQWLKQGLFDLISNVLLFEVPGTNAQQFHFRFAIDQTESFRSLDPNTQKGLLELYNNYFYERQDEFWKEEAMNKLPAMKRATNMLICGEDLGMVPATVPEVMKSLGILSLEIQRMPKDPKKTFFHPADAPYLSVVMPSTHDMSTIRGWWKEDYDRTQRFFNNELGQTGKAPQECEAWINRAIVYQHLYSPAMWSIFQLQDLMGMDEKLRRNNPDEERINIPANPKHYWRYRMHISLEDLINEFTFNDDLLNAVKVSGR